MSKCFIVLFLALILTSVCAAQSTDSLALAKAEKERVVHEKKMADSLRMARLLAISEYPYVKGTKWSGVIPVADPTEIPNPNQDYKLLFDFSSRNPDSLSKEINTCLDEVARVLNLHVASGIPGKRILPVVIIRGGGMETVASNDRYRKVHSIDNPNVKLVRDLQDVGTRFIVCGQSMAFRDLRKEDLLPGVRISLTAQTVFSNYLLQGYVRYTVVPDP